MEKLDRPKALAQDSGAVPQPLGVWLEEHQCQVEDDYTDVFCKGLPAAEVSSRLKSMQLVLQRHKREVSEALACLEEWLDCDAKDFAVLPLDRDQLAKQKARLAADTQVGSLTSSPIHPLCKLGS